MGFVPLKKEIPESTFQLTVYEAEALTNQALNLPAPRSWTSYPPELREVYVYCYKAI